MSVLEIRPFSLSGKVGKVGLSFTAIGFEP